MGFKTAKDRWKYDNNRIKNIENALNTTVIIVWENDYRSNKPKTISDTINKIKKIKELNDR